MEMERRAQAIDAETDVSLAGDPGNVRYSLTGQMQFYLMNSGTAVLDDSTILLLVDGVQQTSNVTTTVVNGGAWSSGGLLQVQVVDNTFPYTNNSEVMLTVVVSSDVFNNVRGTDTLDAEVRLVV
jgi:archaellum component FlaG (FlaF/FlaG flagellin family)